MARNPNSKKSPDLMPKKVSFSSKSKEALSTLLTVSAWMVSISLSLSLPPWVLKALARLSKPMDKILKIGSERE